jgi:cerevisin
MVWDGQKLRGFCANMKSHCIDALNGMEDVALVEKSRTISISKALRRPGSTWGLARISSTETVTGDPNALNYTYEFNGPNAPGAGVDIYLIDTGINTEHIAFAGRAKMVWPNSTEDDNGHGTHTAGTAGAATFGVAYGANILGLKALDKNGVGSTASMIAGIQFATQNHQTRSTEVGFTGSVMSLSFSMLRPADPISGMTALEMSINAAIDAGIHVVVASGNDGSDSCLTDPAFAGGGNGRAISVGSIGMGNAVSSFSNTGACTDIYAPGEMILSTWMGANKTIKADSGTSMATPHVSGIVAYLMTMNRNLAQSPAAMKKYILDTALKNMITGQVQNDALLMVNNGIIGDGFISSH